MFARRWIYEPYQERIADDGSSISGWLYCYRDGVRVYMGGIAACPSHEDGDREGHWIADALNAAERAQLPAEQRPVG
mgnify:CR=1 FL=1